MFRGTDVGFQARQPSFAATAATGKIGRPASSFSTKGGGGTGLGLVVVKKVVEEHGGSVQVESKAGHGSAFHLHFPRAEAP